MKENKLNVFPKSTTEEVKKEDKANRLNESFDRFPMDDACSIGEVEWTDSANNKVDGRILAPRLFIINPELNEGCEYHDHQQINGFVSYASNKQC